MVLDALTMIEIVRARSSVNRYVMLSVGLSALSFAYMAPVVLRWMW
ncbi:hypothetical protein GA0115242_119647 [Streptomyces sp. SolWspMP-5a-2]|nr:hypothetical protein GA0115242_119647 [Streptomyces sp. SolWspMP-5a-2]